MPGGGIEPPWAQGPPDFESSASTNSAISAQVDIIARTAFPTGCNLGAACYNGGGMTTAKKCLFGAVVIAFGLVVMLMSFLTAKQEVFELTPVCAADKEFYLSRNIHPDHVLYPAMAFFDQLQLKLTPEPQQRVMLRVSFSRNRLFSTQVLFERDRDDLAMDTLNKSHHYWLLAADEVLKNDCGKVVADYVKRYSLFMDQELETLTAQMTDAQRARVDTIREEQHILREKL